MDSLKLTGLQVAGAVTLLSAAASYFLRHRGSSSSSSPSTPTRTRTNNPGSFVFFFSEEGSQCTSQHGHKTSECPLQECPLKHQRIIISLLKKAKSSLDICLYNLTHPDLEEAIIHVLRGGVRVRCVVGDREDEERLFAKRLRSEGAFVVVKSHTPPPRLTFKCSELLVHHKFVIIDNQYLITGSVNWTKDSFQRNYDHMIISVDRYLVQQFQNEFNYLHSTEDRDERSCTIRPRGDVPFQVCFFRRNNICCRVDANRKKPCEREDCMFFVYKSIIHKIVSATASIDICVQQITVEELSNELIFAHENGVKIRVISEEDMSTLTGGQIGVLVRAGIPVHLQTGVGRMHHKFIIVDGKILLSGSLNWTMQAFFGNYENLLVISQKDVVSRFQTEFDRLWDKFPPLEVNVSLTVEKT